MDSTVRYLGVEREDALRTAEKIDIRGLDERLLPFVFPEWLCCQGWVSCGCEPISTYAAMCINVGFLNARSKNGKNQSEFCQELAAKVG